MYSEHLERYCTSLAYFSQKKAICYNIINNTYNLKKLSSFSYGRNKNFGYVDSTGTSARDSMSNFLIEKAISELLEKNELFLFWYHGLGTIIKKNNYIHQILKKYGLNNLDCYLFKCNNISSWPTVILIAAKENKIITTGICCNKNLNKAIENAINEAKTLWVLNKMKLRASLICNEETHIHSIEYIKKFRNKKNHDKFKYIKSLDIHIANWIKDLSITFIGITKGKYKAISVSSDSLIKCVPSQKNIEYCFDTKIFKNFPVQNLQNHIECIII